MAMDWNLEKLGQLCKFYCYLCLQKSQRGSEFPLCPICLFMHSCFSGRIPKKTSNQVQTSPNLMLMRKISIVHTHLCQIRHMWYIYYVWTGRKSICAPEKLCICPYRHPSPAFLSWFSGRPQEDLEVPFILRKPVLGWRVTLLAESLNLSERLYDRKSRTPLPK